MGISRLSMEISKIPLFVFRGCLRRFCPLEKLPYPFDMGQHRATLGPKTGSNRAQTTANEIYCLVFLCFLFFNVLMGF